MTQIEISRKLNRSQNIVSTFLRKGIGNTDQKVHAYSLIKSSGQFFEKFQQKLLRELLTSNIILSIVKKWITVGGRHKNVKRKKTTVTEAPY